MHGRIHRLTGELKHVIRVAGKNRDELLGKLPELATFACVQGAGDDEEQLYRILYVLIPDFAARLPTGPNGSAIRELLAWDDPNGQPQSLKTRYHLAAAHLQCETKDFGRRKEYLLLADCARRFVTFDQEDRASRATADLAGVHGSAPPTSTAMADIAGVHPRLDYAWLAKQMRGAGRIAILNTWIPEVSFLAQPLADALAHGTVVQVLMLHPDSHAAALRTTGLRGSDEALFHEGQVRHGVRQSLDVLGSTIAGSLDAAGRSRLQVRLYDSLPSIAVYAVDERALVSVFLHGKLAVESPQLEVHGTSSLIGGAVAGEFATLWRIAEQMEFRDIRVWRAELAGMKLATHRGA